MAIRKHQDSFTQGGEPLPESKSQVEPKKQSRIQTAEGWKRSQLKKGKLPKDASKS